MHLSVAARLSVRPVRPPHADVAGLLLWARRAADIDRLLHGRRAAATPRGGRMPRLSIKNCKQTYVVKFRQLCCQLQRHFATAVVGPSARVTMRVRRGISDFYTRVHCVLADI